MRSYVLSLVACITIVWMAFPAGASPQYLTVINDSPERINTLQIVRPGSEAWITTNLGRDGLAGGDEATIDLPRSDSGCVYDVRITFRRGPRLLHRGVNLCKYARYRTGALRREARRYRSQW